MKCFFMLFLALFYIQTGVEAACISPTVKEIKALENQLIKLINDERNKHRLGKLVECKDLVHHAKEHSQNRASGRISLANEGHAGFEQRAAAIRHCGRHCAFGENVAYLRFVADPVQVAVNEWMRSSDHRDNILGDYDETGVGIAFDRDGRCFLTQLFGKRTGL